MKEIELLIFKHNDKDYRVMLGRFCLGVDEIDGYNLWYRELFCFCDCATYNNGYLLWGDRMGQFHCVNLDDTNELRHYFISKDSEEFYIKETSPCGDMWEYAVMNRKLNTNDYLPEMNIANSICSNMSISAMTSYENYVIIGDLSGRIALFDINTKLIIKNLKVAGPVKTIMVSDGRVLIDYVDAHRELLSPDEFKKFTDLIRVEYDFQDFFVG